MNKFGIVSLILSFSCLMAEEPLPFEVYVNIVTEDGSIYVKKDEDGLYRIPHKKENNTNVFGEIKDNESKVQFIPTTKLEEEVSFAIKVDDKVSCFDPPMKTKHDFKSDEWHLICITMKCNKSGKLFTETIHIVFEKRKDIEK